MDTLLTVVNRMKLGSYLSSWILAMSSGVPDATFLEAVFTRKLVTSVVLVKTWPSSVWRVGRVPLGF